MVLAFGFLLVISPPLEAHNYLPSPKEGERETHIEDIGVSRVAYREITARDQLDLYRFHAEEGEEIYAQLLVPHIDRFEGFMPSMSFFHITDETGEPSELMHSEMELKGGAVVFEDQEVSALYRRSCPDCPQARFLVRVDSDGATEVFSEPFTGTRYRERQSISFPAPRDGDYHIAVFHRAGEQGKYVLATGRREEFSLGDILRLPAVRLTVRDFMEAGVAGDLIFWTGAGCVAVGGILLAIVALVRW
jgi:hypothetical protein